jgi:CBS domain-containing protein
LSASNSERSHSFPKIACYISRLQRRLLSQDVTSNRSVEEEVDVHEIEEVSRAEDLIAFRDMTLGEILQQKKTIDSLVSIAETETVFEAIRTMDNNGIGAILVRDGKGDYIGIFTERDYLRKIALKGLSSRTTQVKDVMTRNLYTATNTDMATAMMHKMTQSRFRHVPVKDIETGQVIGIVSIGDIMKGVLGELADTAAFLRDFVQGKYAKLG